jgi:hypothetical protein
MAASYKLIFRGEVLAGQHPAVVRRRLAASYGAEHLELLFSGRPVVLKRSADAATAARLQALFNQAGAKLQVIAAVPPGGDQAVAGAAGSTAHAPAGLPPMSGLQLLPSGTPVLRDDERAVPQQRDIDTGSLSLAAAGAQLGPQSTPPEPPVDVTLIDFEVAPVGATLGAGSQRAAPPPPDTSHLSLANP